MNIHLTGCHHSCAQHYIGDIGLHRLQGRDRDDGDTVEGYHVLVGGGFGPDAGLAREIFMDVRAEDAPATVERLLQSLSDAPQLVRRDLPRLLAPARRRGAQGDVRGGGGMSAAPRPPIPQLIPESAPFSAEQRTWLNGFFAGLVSLDGAVTPLSSAESAALMPAPPAAADDGRRRSALARPDAADGRTHEARRGTPAAPPDDGGDGATGLRTMRLQLSGLFRRDLFKKGGAAESLRARRQGNRPDAQDAVRGAWQFVADHDELVDHAGCRCFGCTGRRASRTGRSRDNPVEATFLSRTRLNKPGSEKETWHVEFDLAGSGLDYAVGDAFGLFPTNDPALADHVIAALGASRDFPIGGRALRDVLIDDVSLGAAPDMLFQLFSYITGGERRQKAKALAAGEDPDGDAATLDVLAAIEKFRGVRPDPEAFIEALDPLQPRLYSIASSPKVDAGRMALCVDTVRYAIDGRTRLGVASTFLAERVEPRRPAQGLCAEGARLRPARRSVGADHHDRPRHRHRAVPRLPARAHGDQGARPQLAVLRPSAQRLRFLLRGRAHRHEGRAAC